MLSATAALIIISVFQTVNGRVNALSPLQNVTSAFTQVKIVPDILPTFRPAALLNLTFAASPQGQAVNVTPGVFLSTQQTTTAPQLFMDSNSTSKSNKNGTFVVAMIDPDAPSPQMPTFAQILHFLGGDFKSNSSSHLLVNSTPASMEYIAPGPPAGSDPHRYVLVVYNQPANFSDHVTSFVNGSTSRENFSLSSFAKSLRLGNPIAGNFFFVSPADNTTTTSSTAPVPSTSAAESSATEATSSTPTPQRPGNGSGKRYAVDGLGMTTIILVALTFCGLV